MVHQWKMPLPLLVFHQFRYDFGIALPQAEHSGQHPRNLGAILHGHSGMLAPPPRGAPDPIRTAP